MPQLSFRHPSRRTVVLASALILYTATVVGTYCWAQRHILPAKPVDWLATAAKLVGLAFTAALGIVGTATDTKQPLPTGGFRIRPVGWFVVVAIVLAALIGGVGQWFEDQAKKEANAAQLARLERIAATSEKTLLRFSGHLSLWTIVNVRLDNPALAPITAKYKAALDEFRAWSETSPLDADQNKLQLAEDVARIQYKRALTALVFDVELYYSKGTEKRRFLARSVSGAPSDWTIDHIDVDHGVLNATFSHRIDNFENDAFLTKSDFGNAVLTVSYGEPGERGAYIPLQADIYYATLSDEEVRMQLTRAKLKRTTRQDYIGFAPTLASFSGRTEQLARLTGTAAR